MRVLVAGGGVAALEVLAGLNALAGDRVDATLLAPDAHFSYRPLSTAVPFTFRSERQRPLAELANDLGAQLVRDALVDVDTSRNRVLTRRGDFLSYDALVVAVGARATRTPQPGLTFRRDSAGVAAFGRILEELEAGAVTRVAFVVPDDAAWPVDAYELSLVAARAARRAGTGAEVILLTAEERPLEALGGAAGEAVGDELDRAGVRLQTAVRLGKSRAREDAGMDAFSSVIARLARRTRGGRRRRIVLRPEADSVLTIDRAVSLLAVRGPAIAGLPHDHRGFLEVDGHGRIADSGGLFAAGDATSLPLKHSTLSTAQATAVAEALAAEAGAPVEPEPATPMLYGILALPPRFPGPGGSPWVDSGQPATHCVWWPPGHVSGRHLAAYLAERDHRVHPGLLWHPRGLPVAAAVGSPRDEGAGQRPLRQSERLIEDDARTRQLLEVRRSEREGERLAHELEHEGLEFERHEHEVVARLEAAGYLRHER